MSIQAAADPFEPSNPQAWQKLTTAIKAINKNDLNDLKAMKKPAPLVEKVMSVLAEVTTGKKKTTWQNHQQLLMDLRTNR